MLFVFPNTVIEQLSYTNTKANLFTHSLYKFLTKTYNLTVEDVDWEPAPTKSRTKPPKTTSETLTTKATEPSSTAPSKETSKTTATSKLPTSEKITKQGTIGTPQSNLTSNVTASITTIGSMILKVTTRSVEPTSTTAPPKVPKAPKAKASESRGEVQVIIDPLKSLYLTYWFIKGTLIRNLSTNVIVT